MFGGREWPLMSEEERMQRMLAKEWSLISSIFIRGRREWRHFLLEVDGGETGERRDCVVRERRARWFDNLPNPQSIRPKWVR